MREIIITVDKIDSFNSIHKLIITGISKIGWSLCIVNAYDRAHAPALTILLKKV